MGLETDPLYEVIQAVQGFYARKDAAHDLGHALRVRSWGKKLALEEGADSIIVELSAILHDIGRSSALEKSHADSSAGLAANILQKCGYDEELILKVKNAIITHSREAEREPRTIEAEVLYDADKLDFVGPLGLARLFSLAGSQGLGFTGPNSCEEYYQDRILKYRDYLYTESGKRYFEPLFQYMEGFWQKLHEQMA